MKKKININKTNKRGRPIKKFVSKKTDIKRDKPGRPKKHEKASLPQIPKKTENKKKDRIILGLFVVSFCIFCFSIYVNQKDKLYNLLNNETTNPFILNNNTQNKETIIEEPKTIIEEPIIIEEKLKNEVVDAFYQAIKSREINNIYQYVDNKLKQSKTFRIYFSKNRITRFIDNIDNNISRKITKIEDSIIYYNLEYSIKNIPFLEEREANITNTQDGSKITKIMCTTKGCSTMPFFNPGKYF